MKIVHTGFQLATRVINYKDDEKSFPALTLGSGSYAGDVNYENVGSRNHVLIGNYSSIANSIRFVIGINHDYKMVSTYPFSNPDLFGLFKASYSDMQPFDYSSDREFNPHQVIIGNDVWIGLKVTIMGGVHIGNGAVIGANAVVAKDIPPYAIAVGNPIKIIKYRFDEETIKKFMAVKWWNWDLKKILENAPLMDNPKEFLKKHYSPELEKISEENIQGGVGILQKYLAEDRKIYSYVADFHVPQPLWKRVISGFCKSTLNDSVLIFWLGENATQADIETLKNFVNNLGLSENKIIHCIPAENDKIFSPYILRNSTHFITTREMISLECMDWLWDTKVKIVSALDDKIFDGEPAVNWNKIFEE